MGSSLRASSWGCCRCGGDGVRSARARWRAGGPAKPGRAILQLAGSHERALSALCLRRGRRHVPDVKKFGVCFSWEVPVWERTERLCRAELGAAGAL